ncbi:unnamed protein product, partial [Bubo scandiacus]
QYPSIQLTFLNCSWMHCLPCSSVRGYKVTTPAGAKPSQNVMPENCNSCNLTKAKNILKNIWRDNGVTEIYFSLSPSLYMHTISLSHVYTHTRTQKSLGTELKFCIQSSEACCFGSIPMVRGQAVALQPMEVHGGADAHLQLMEDPTPERPHPHSEKSPCWS